ncbi:MULTISPECIES: DegT/DnrJ/EryC1/StrS aminotransferase family protein [unclassified Legionella]|uniref:DegT/DnrJ/EryC1/StrS family aminotransferase n=1 Tax=unclassified Legionella TaxID=2622702 RepID=UPI001054CC67|nr:MULTISPECIES: DegT/DnrJ/EryC1/StrS family aminotransferase [unclassified Legionella]MDI9817771.1 DegT/DnrJ/EryC1/StrS family aminotransferase [Legionella sp. PL877]
MSNKPVYVTQPTLPSLDEFTPYLQEIWNSKILTNGGGLHKKLESALRDYLGVNHISLFNNGTIALITALKALNITGEVITTPYSFIATAHSLLWNNLTPVFVDIDPETLNLNPDNIEAAITERTTAILPVHCYGYACDVKQIRAIANRYGLKIIYDAAHAFAVEDEEGSILNHGDLSVLSFHATKVFNTFEGGAIVCHDETMKNKINRLKNFGIVDETTITEVGINGKMSEINAAMGLLQLNHIQTSLTRRRQVDDYYRKRLNGIKGIRLMDNSREKVANYSYFPILVNKNYSLSRDELYEQLRQNGIFARRYFYPLISNFSMYSNLPSARKEKLIVANEVSSTILCLPIYADLSVMDQERVIDIILKGGI